jgi:galactose mutarotase-like enzyme
MKEDVELGVRRLTLENGVIRLQVLPEVGGKVTSLFHVPGGQEFIYQPPDLSRGYSVPGYGALFKDFDNSGFDECIPTVGACPYPNKAAGELPDIQLPDHGEVWSVPWQSQSQGESLELQCRGTQLPFLFQKVLTLNGSTVTISYKVENTSFQELIYLWSSHPLLVIHPGDHIRIPPEVHNVFIDQSHTGRLGGFGNRCNWPVAAEKSGRLTDLSLIHPPDTNAAEKFFTPRLSQGWCALDSPARGHSLTFRFDPHVVPFVGMWINQGGWPVHSSEKHYCIALEPCNGAPDSLEKAVEMGQANSLGARETRTWQVEIELRAGPPDV